MSDEKLRAAPGTVDYEDVDDVIGIAAKMKQADEDKLTVDDVRSVGRELDIPEHYVDRALTALDERRHREAQARALRSRRMRIAGVIAAVIAVLTLASALHANSSVQSSAADADYRRAQWQSAIERRTRVHEHYDHAAASEERDAELDGADNRVSIARRRYDQSATEYNREVSSFPISMWARLFGRPVHVPLSNETSP